ncbi:MAG TPA: hypothetical protein VJ813_09055 [Vicinamibacterales bacterium]|nr:hypothetical protein [Vicinamibacterales bacterium]
MLLGRATLHALCLAAIVAAVPAPVRCAEPLAPPSPLLGRHVRGVTPAMTHLIDQGIRRSRTFKRLIAALDESDVIVYLEVTKALPAGLDGRLMFITSAGGVRYLHAQITSSLDFDDLIAVAGHELQHALEVAEHRNVRDSTDLEMLYMRIGIPSPVKHRYDTVAARITGRRVRAELS